MYPESFLYCQTFMRCKEKLIKKNDSHLRYIHLELSTSTSPNKVIGVWKFDKKIVMYKFDWSMCSNLNHVSVRISSKQ